MIDIVFSILMAILGIILGYGICIRKTNEELKKAFDEIANNDGLTFGEAVKFMKILEKAMEKL